jgi:hypothetical protein
LQVDDLPAEFAVRVDRLSGDGDERQTGRQRNSFGQDGVRRASAERDQRADRPGFNETRFSLVLIRCRNGDSSARPAALRARSYLRHVPRVSSCGSSSSTAGSNGVVTRHLRRGVPSVASRMGLEQEDFGGEIMIGVGAADTRERAPPQDSLDL